MIHFVVGIGLLAVVSAVVALIHVRRKRETLRTGRSKSRLLGEAKIDVAMSRVQAISMVTSVLATMKIQDIRVDSESSRVQGFTRVSIRSWGTVISIDVVRDIGGPCHVVCRAWPRLESTLQDWGESKRKAESFARMLRARTAAPSDVGSLSLDELRAALVGILGDLGDTVASAD